MPSKDVNGTQTLRLCAERGNESAKRVLYASDHTRSGVVRSMRSEFFEPSPDVRWFDIAISMLRDRAFMLFTSIEATARKRTHALFQSTHRLLSATMPQTETGVNQLVGEAVNLINSVAIAHDVHIEHSLDSRDPRVAGDAQQLREMLMALILHAVTLTLNADPDHRGIRISTMGTSNTVAICVKNQCPESFGVGIGMPLVRRIVEAHGGSLKAHHLGDQGFNIQITLPGLRRKSHRLLLEPAIG